MARSPWLLLALAAALVAPVALAGAPAGPSSGEASAVGASAVGASAVEAPTETTSAARSAAKAAKAEAQATAEPPTCGEPTAQPPTTPPDAGPAALAADPVDTPPVAAPAPQVPLSGREVSVLDAGAVGDGVTDDTAALQRALDQAGPGDVVVVPQGRTFAHDDVVRLRSDGVTLTGGGTLLSTDPARSTLWVEADDATVSGITLAGTATRRGHTWDDTGLLLKGTEGVLVDGVTVRGATSAGIFVDSSSGFVLRDVLVEDSLADGIHLTGGSRDGVLLDPVVRRSGDDGIGVVSYRDAEPVRDIRIERPRVETTTWGRGLSVVGGERVSYTDVLVEGSDAAALYFASEANWNTHATSGVSVDGGSVVGVNTSETVDHGAVLVFSGDAARPVSDVRVTGLTIADTDDRASREVGVLGAPATGIVMEDVDVLGSERTLFVSTNDASDLRLTGWTRNGEPVADVVQ